MKCLKTGEEVLQEDCEPCVDIGACDPVCAKMDLVIGAPDGMEPRFVLSAEEAREKEEDISWFWLSRNDSVQTGETPKGSGGGKSRPKVPECLKWDVWERDNFTCQNYGVRRYLTLDHVWPLARGGRTEASNLQTLCHSCNSRKKDR